MLKTTQKRKPEYLPQGENTSNCTYLWDVHDSKGKRDNRSERTIMDLQIVKWEQKYIRKLISTFEPQISGGHIKHYHGNAQYVRFYT